MHYTNENSFLHSSVNPFGWKYLQNILQPNVYTIKYSERTKGINMLFLLHVNTSANKSIGRSVITHPAYWTTNAPWHWEKTGSGSRRQANGWELHGLHYMIPSFTISSNNSIRHHNQSILKQRVVYVCFMGHTLWLYKSWRCINFS